MTKQEVFKTFYERQELIQVYNYRFFKQTTLLINLFYITTCNTSVQNFKNYVKIFVYNSLWKI